MFQKTIDIDNRLFQKTIDIDNCLFQKTIDIDIIDMYIDIYQYIIILILIIVSKDN